MGGRKILTGVGGHVLQAAVGAEVVQAGAHVDHRGPIAGQRLFHDLGDVAVAFDLEAARAQMPELPVPWISAFRAPARAGFDREQGFFPLPEPLIQGPATRIMSLRDGSKKMSKSDPSDYSRINLTDGADEIAHQIAHQIATWTAMIPVLDSGEHCPHHFRGRRPLQGR